MKKILLLAAAALMVTSANAHLKPRSLSHVTAPTIQVMKPEVQTKVAQMRLPGTPVLNAPKKAANIDFWYQRPAGMFYGVEVVEDGVASGLLYAPYMLATPYATYTFNGVTVGETPNTTYEWDVQFWDQDDPDAEEPTWTTVTDCGKNLSWAWGLEIVDVPQFWVFDDDFMDMGYLEGFQMGGTQDKPSIVERYSASIFVIPNWEVVRGWEGTDILESSKDFCWGGHYGKKRAPMITYTGADPYDPTDEEGAGYWFGKNGGAGGGYRVDGIAQAFEKPTAPYRLNYVAVDCSVLEVAEEEQVEMTCKVYKLDEIPAYIEDGEAMLPDEPGELIAKGRAIVTSETEATTNGLVFFTLYGEEDGLEYDITPTIDCAILVVVDGYNDPEQAGLLNFSAMACTEDDFDEGYGELAYLKLGVPDEDGNLDHYVWAGLNNFFSSAGDMKSGFTIFISTDHPYMRYYFAEENGEYLFPNAGGKFEKTFDGETYNEIVFDSWEANGTDGNWYLTCNGDDVPSWLNIELEDYTNAQGEFTGIVFASVSAEPLPEGMKYREAVVRFEYDGAYLDYTFMQGEKSPGLRGDVNGDGSVNIADINEVIDMILGGRFASAGDVNEDGAVNIGDINAIIAIILK